MGSDSQISTNQSIVLYDGVCNFCNSSVNFIIRHERQSELKFASLQSAFGQNVLHSYNEKTNDFESIVFIHNNVIFKKSKAAFEISKFLKPPWNWLAVFQVFPRFITDFFYDVIAKNRYAIFGKSDTCAIPTPALRSRFLDVV
ncbi:thiol-disulfide oxidoreductase DCC family protein [Reichenbachiella sp. MALMAid0571]|uniref:thiol-disulfide oxidoreductase DCC family protein n=1 Tax=Reichenbachiella sp. MALMAid0571 TaxID=3143939 RepID=UPI0032DF217E